MKDEVLFGARKETLNHFKHLYEGPWIKKYSQENKTKELRERMYTNEFKRVKNYFDLKIGGNVLDIGCGTGDFLELFGDNWNKYGIEISEKLKKILREKRIITNFEFKENFFDIIIFRGTIQHIPDPISKIEKCYYWLKKGGGIVFLATPNTNSLVYKLFNDLPMLAEEFNFLLPSDKMLKQILTNFRFRNIKFYYPYGETPYAKPFRDKLSLIYWYLFRRREKPTFAFPKNVMECYARK